MINQSNNKPPRYTKEDLHEVLRLILIQIITWSRFYIISKLSNINDIEIVKNRLFEISRSLSNIFKIYYGANFGKTIEDLIFNYLKNLTLLIDALAEKNTIAEKTYQELLKNTIQSLANELSQKNPYWNQYEIENLFSQQKDLILNEVTKRINKDYVSDIYQYDNIIYHSLMLADILWKGLLNQFYPSSI